MLLLLFAILRFHARTLIARSKIFTEYLHLQRHDVTVNSVASATLDPAIADEEIAHCAAVRQLPLIPLALPDFQLVLAGYRDRL